MKLLKKDKKQINFSSSSESSESSEEEGESEYSESKNDIEEENDGKEKRMIFSPNLRNSSLHLKRNESLKARRSTYIELHNLRDKDQMIKRLFDENEIKNKKNIDKKRSSSISELVKTFYEKNNNMNKYYEVNLDKIHFMIYDFNKDIIVDGSKDEVSIKIKNLLYNSENLDRMSFSENNGNYPYISLKHKLKKNKKEDDDKNKNSQNEIMDTKNSHKRKINDAINNEENETIIIKLRAYLIIFFIVMLLFSGLILFINLHYNNIFIDILNLIKTIISIKYCNKISLYYVRELTLLNLNIPNLNGGEYLEIPANKSNREDYRKMLRVKLRELFYENQSYLKTIFSSSYSPSETTSNNLFQLTLYPLFLFNKKFENTSSEIFSTLIQYNNELYNLAMSQTLIEQNHPDLFNFIYNSFNEYGKGINLLIGEYESELNIQKKITNIILISLLIFYFLISLIINIIIIKSFVSADKTRENYMKIFYGINIHLIKNLMINCENFMNYLRKNKNNIENETESKDSERDNNSLIQKVNENKNDKRNSLINDEKRNISYKNLIFFFLYFLYALIMYLYFILNFFFMTKLIKKSVDTSNFYFRLSVVQLNLIDIFNSYREYVFDNTTTLFYKNSFYIIKEIEKNIDDNIESDIRFINYFISSNFLKYKEALSLSSKDICSYFITDYFKSIEECKNKFEETKYEFLVIISNFIRKINSAKNIVKYIFTIKNVIGNLTEYDKEKWITMGNNLLEQEGDKPTIFRLDLFNDKEIHSDLNLMFINIFLPFIDNIRKTLLNKINFEGNENIFLSLFIIYLLLGSLILLFYWVPKVRSISSYIYKTKKILLIIPMSILSSQDNIKYILKL